LPPDAGAPPAKVPPLLGADAGVPPNRPPAGAEVVAGAPPKRLLVDADVVAPPPKIFPLGADVVAPPPPNGPPAAGADAGGAPPKRFGAEDVAVPLPNMEGADAGVNAGAEDLAPAPGKLNPPVCGVVEAGPDVAGVEPKSVFGCDAWPPSEPNMLFDCVLVAGGVFMGVVEPRLPNKGLLGV
jgi:hypothetical protein